MESDIDLLLSSNKSLIAVTMMITDNGKYSTGTSLEVEIAGIIYNNPKIKK